MALGIFKRVLNEKGPFSRLYLLRIQRLGSRKPIQNIRFKKWSKVGLCIMSPGRENMMSSIRSPFPLIFCPCVFYCGCGSQRMILVLSNQVEITTKSPGRERWNLIWTFGHQFLGSTVNIRLKNDLFRAGETCHCSNDLLRIFSTVDFDTRKISGKSGRPLLEKPVSWLWDHGWRCK